MKKLYLFGMILSAVFAAAGCSKDSGIENDIKPAIPDSERQVVLTGVSNAAVTRTGFDETDGNSIPFIWSAGDYIWVNDTKRRRDNGERKQSDLHVRIALWRYALSGIL